MEMNFGLSFSSVCSGFFTALAENFASNSLKSIFPMDFTGFIRDQIDSAITELSIASQCSFFILTLLSGRAKRLAAPRPPKPAERTQLPHTHTHTHIHTHI